MQTNTQNTSNVIVLVAACVTLATALVPCLKWLWRTSGIRKFDQKKHIYNEIVQQSKWYESRAQKLHILQSKLQVNPDPHKFRRAEWISQLDGRDAEWARTIEDSSLLTQACARKEEECLMNAEQ
jgi:hypothetical protein